MLGLGLGLTNFGSKGGVADAIDKPFVSLLTAGSQFDDVAWVKSSVTVTANATADPEGGSAADKLLNATTSSLIYQVLSTVPPSTTLQFIIWLKTVSGSAETVPYFTNGSGSSPNPNNGTFAVTGAWQRFSVPIGTSASGIMNVGIGTIGGAFPWTVSSGVYAWGAALG